jgi:hypothetical protein
VAARCKALKSKARRSACPRTSRKSCNLRDPLASTRLPTTLRRKSTRVFPFKTRRSFSTKDQSRTESTTFDNSRCINN